MANRVEATRVRLSEEERDSLERLAQLNERSLSAEIRRALRFYFENFESVDRAIRERLGSLASS